MGILAECPICRAKQSTRNKTCKCGEDLDKAKRSGRVKYWIDYRFKNPQNGNLERRRESVDSFDDLNGYSIDDARTALSKRTVQKREKRILDILPESKITFNKLAEWYTGLAAVKKLSTYNRVVLALNRFNQTFGETIVSSLKNVDLEEYQDTREQNGVAPATIDMELSIAQTMVNKAFINDKIGGESLKAFKRTARKLRKGSNARERVVTVAEYLKLVNAAPDHAWPLMVVAYNTGMRVGEVKLLRWPYIDWNKEFIRLPAEATKENRPKAIPINVNVMAVFDALRPQISSVDDTHHDYVFTYQGKPILAPQGIRKAFMAACKDAGLSYGEDGIVFKDFRRSVKTNMVAAGVPKVYRDTILGHSLKGMDVHYIKPSEKDLTAAMATYTEWLLTQSASGDQSGDQGLFLKNGKSVTY